MLVLVEMLIVCAAIGAYEHFDDDLGDVHGHLFALRIRSRIERRKSFTVYVPKT